MLGNVTSAVKKVHGLGTEPEINWLPEVSFAVVTCTE